MADRALKLPVEIEIVNLEEQVRKASQKLGETQLNASNPEGNGKSKIENFYDMMNTVTNMFRGLPGANATDETKAAFGIMKSAGGTSDKIANDVMKVMKTGFGIVEDIHNRIKQASPLLQSVESLFNLAVQLFFMPLGNKLATVMIPAIMELVDGVMEMWQKIEGMDLGEMLTEMIDYGAKIFGQFFNNLGESLAEQTGIVGTLGEIMMAVGDFIENHLADLLKTGLEVLKWIFENLGTLVDAFIEFKIASISLQTAQLGAAMMPPGFEWLGGAIGFGVGEGVGHYVKTESGLQSLVNDLPRSAAGSYVGAVEGGRAVLVAEGGEGEFILPEGRLQSMMDTVSDRMVDVAQAQPAQTRKEGSTSQPINNNFYINGYTDRELVSLIRSTVNEQVSQSRLRSGF